MSFTTVKNEIVGRLRANGFEESSALSFENAPANEHGNCFIIKPLGGENDEDNSETLSDRFYDLQDWQIEIAFSRSEHNEIMTLEELHRKKDVLIADLDKPSNWSNSVRMQKYKSWDVTETPNYHILAIHVKIIDQYIYS